ncbi:MAG: aminotransferase class I/II-fold pyridoxal phosphate-dependent enzyme, partial [Candidatus Deferrimicrobium sp.]|nr:aminotransferase class I/II-fold pyridoxal phosphate-dependent enzyme [Candidatus Deferrimicrobium sp.]
MQAGRTPEEILDFSANINPLGPPEWLRPLVGATLSSVVHYPDPDASALVQAAAKRYGVSTEEVVAGNGTSEILYLLALVPGASRAVIPGPAYVDYAAAARSAGLSVRSVPMKEEDGFALDIPALAAV